MQINVKINIFSNKIRYYWINIREKIKNLVPISASPNLINLRLRSKFEVRKQGGKNRRTIFAATS